MPLYRFPLIIVSADLQGGMLGLRNQRNRRSVIFFFCTDFQSPCRELSTECFKLRGIFVSWSRVESIFSGNRRFYLTTRATSIGWWWVYGRVDQYGRHCPPYQRHVKVIYLRFRLLGLGMVWLHRFPQCAEMGVTGSYRLFALLEYSLILSLPSWKVK